MSAKRVIQIPEKKLTDALVRKADDPMWRLDWPDKEGPIDLATQDLPHDSANTEWWYLNSHFKTEEGKELSIFAAFFRIVRHYDPATQVAQYAHTLLYAVADPADQQYYPVGYVDPDCCHLIIERLKTHKATDKKINIAMLEMLEQGVMPLPDVPMDDRTLRVATDKLDLNFSGNTLTKDAQGAYHLKCHLDSRGVGFDLKFQPQKQAIRQGHKGLTHVGRKGEEMFYYFIPRHAVTGNVTLGGKTSKVVGQGWYDHEFGGTIQPSATPAMPRIASAAPLASPHKGDDEDSKMQMDGDAATPATKKAKSAASASGGSMVGGEDIEYGWHWSSIQLNNGVDISSTYLFNAVTREVVDQYTIVIDPHSTRTEFSEMAFAVTGTWDSVRTYQTFPINFRLTAPGAGIDLELKASVPDSEFITAISEPSFWEGRVVVKGTCMGEAVTGFGFVEVHGYQTLKRLDTFLKAVSAQVSKYVDKIIPNNASHTHLLNLMGGPGFEHYTDGLSLQTFNKTIIDPLRAIIDRGGKAWRSYACLLCIDCVGGDSRDHPEMLAMPELMHVGSLIVDDIQDKSDTRRGGPSCHKMYGDAIAINAGNAAYFLSQFGFKDKKIPADRKVRLYEIYFEALRAGHIGQGADIFGLDYRMEDVVSQGGGADLLRAVCGTHRLKSAAPAGALARMGSILGNGTDEQTDKLGRFFEALGVAFQIMDDVLNLRGMRSGKQTLKVLGEDIMEGKITYPVAKAMCSWDLATRTRMWNIIKSKPQDQSVVAEVITAIESCGGLEGSVDDATTMVDEAWATLAGCLPNSFYKAMLRAFAFFVLDRHY